MLRRPNVATCNGKLPGNISLNDIVGDGIIEKQVVECFHGVDDIILGMNFFPVSDDRTVADAVSEVGDSDFTDKFRIHHLNPITKEDVIRHSEKLLDPENAVCVSAATHKVIHYGMGKGPKLPDGERKPGDTCPWRRTCF